MRSTAVSVVVDYRDRSGNAATAVFPFTNSDISALPLARLTTYECGLDVGDIARWLGGIVVGLVALGVFLMLGTTALVAAVRRTVKGTPLDP